MWSSCFRPSVPDDRHWDEQVRHALNAWVAEGSRGALRWMKTKTGLRSGLDPKKCSSINGCIGIVVFACDAKRHGATAIARRLFDSCLRVLPRRH